MFYHISSQKGLTELEPRISTHGKPYVYALTDPKIGLVFAGRDDLGIKADDSYYKYGLLNQIPEVYELYSGCLDETLKNKDCYIYELEDSGFLANQTTWSPEWVSPNKTKVISSQYVPDILSEIKKLESQGQFIIHYYENTESYNKFVEDRIKNMLLHQNYGWIGINYIRHYEKIVKEYVKNNLEKDFRQGYENLSKEQLQNVFQQLDKDNNHGKFVRKELFYFYPEETINWINKKYQKAHEQQLEK